MKTEEPEEEKEDEEPEEECTINLTELAAQTTEIEDLITDNLIDQYINELGHLNFDEDLTSLKQQVLNVDCLEPDQVTVSYN